MSEYWIDLRRSSASNTSAFIATGRGVGAPGESLSHTFSTYEELRHDFDSLGVTLTLFADRQLSGGLKAAIKSDEQTLRLLGLWELPETK